MKELVFESELIQRLCTGDVCTLDEADSRILKGIPAKTKLWEYCGDLDTDEKLWKNFRAILEQNNFNKLKHGRLSDAEFERVKRQIESLQTPYEAGKFLYGVNGVCQIDLELDDGTRKMLTVFDQKQIGAGNTRYQVVNQVVREPRLPGYGTRRFDTTLLINGLPIIQIEEKKDTNNVNEALEQIHRYQVEGLYSGIYSTIQIFVAMTPHSIRYMANCTSDKFNTDFAFQWQKKGDFRENPEVSCNITDWKEFTDSMLSIPMAHRMATNYMILDSSKNDSKLMVMRPYQVYAAEAVLHSIRTHNFFSGDKKGGYIWHSTGTGKTVTSFKTAWLAKRMPQIDKVVFVVDRKALTNQTLEKYLAYNQDQAYDRNAAEILKVKNTGELERKLTGRGSDIIITSTQKLMRLVKKRDFRDVDKRFLFIVDEAHRTTRGESFADIQKAFRHALFVGYTGTPAFERDAGQRNTRDIFGELLHAYTIREAIADKNVLGFNVSFKDTIPHERLVELLSDLYKQRHPEWTQERILEETEQEFPEGIDDTETASLYDMNLEHISVVVLDIFKNWKNRSVEGQYNAILTTHVSGAKASAPMAAMYYQEFKRMNEQRAKEGKFTLKVALTYTLSGANTPKTVFAEQKLKEAMQDYNQMFGTNFDLDTYDEYFQDLTMRMDKKNAGNTECLDLVIVVDQLLTGFDAPKLNTLYVDRTLKKSMLVQAYSRTNRIDKQDIKPFGRIINYRFPRLNEREMEKALAIYSDVESAMAAQEGEYVPKDKGDKGDGVTVPPFKTVLQDAKELKQKLEKETNGFQGIPNSEKGREEMLDDLSRFNHLVAMLKQYDPGEDEEGNPVGFDPDKPDELTSALGMEPDDYNKLIYGLKNALVDAVAKDRSVPPEQILLQMVSIKKTRVNFDYLTELLNRLIKYVKRHQMEQAKVVKEKLDAYVKTMDDASLAKRVSRSADVIMRGGMLSKEERNKLNKDVMPVMKMETEVPVKLDPDEMMTLEAILLAAYEFADNEQYDAFRQFWGLEDLMTNADLKAMVLRHHLGKMDSFEKNALNQVKKQIGKNVLEKADKSVQSLSLIRFKNELSSGYQKLADDLVRNS